MQLSLSSQRRASLVTHPSVLSHASVLRACADAPRPVVKFTNLKLTCEQGTAGISLEFTVAQGA